jgi:hypothetical protein
MATLSGRINAQGLWNIGLVNAPGTATAEAVGG